MFRGGVGADERQQLQRLGGRARVSVITRDTGEQVERTGQ